MNGYTLKQIHEAILKADNILLIPHQNPDGDALGASTAFALWLESLDKKFTLFCKTPVSAKLSHLPLEKLTSDPRIWKQHYDVIVVFDSGDLAYAGVAEEIEETRLTLTLINIDHHPTNKLYGDINFVDTKASSTSEIIEKFFLHNHIAITRAMATSLLTGFVTDTDNFTNAATSSLALSSASHLLKSGGKMTPTQERVYKNISISALKVWGLMLERLQTKSPLDLVYTYITQNDIKNAGIAESDIEGLANFMNMIEEGKTKLILKEKETNVWKGSFRTTGNEIDVSAFAQAFGGGGHKKAAGFAIEGTLEEVLQKIFQTIEKLS